MRHLTYAQQPSYPLVFLVSSLRKAEIQREYLDPFAIPPGDALALEVHRTPGKKKTPASEMKEWITSELVPVLADQGAQYVLVADPEYFKILAKVQKIDANLGYVLDSPYGSWKVAYVPNYQQVFYDPEKVRARIAQAMTAVVAHATGGYDAPGSGIVKFEAYPKSPAEIKDWLDRLLAMDRPLAIDIEAFSLKHHSAGIGTITLCWSKHEGIAFPVDYIAIPGAAAPPFGRQERNEEVRALLRGFFARLNQTALYHNIAFDVYVLIFQLYMDHLLDTKGLLRGMSVLLRDWDDTKLITYLATNSCAGNKLGLKDQAQEFSGNYGMGEDIKDITRIPLDRLLRYNLIDGLSTWHVYEKHWDTLVADQQLEIYRDLFKPATLDIIQMQLTGMPLNRHRVQEVATILEAIQDKALHAIRANPVVARFTRRLNEKWVEKRNQELKKKRVTLDDAKEVFNPNSGPQLQDLLFTMLGLPVLNLTDSKQPSVDGDTLKALVHHTDDGGIKVFLLAMLEYAAVNKILTAFLPPMLAAPQGPDGWHYLFGNFNLGGTLSGRLSSSDPNLQNLPANVTMVLSAELLEQFKDALAGYVSKGSLNLGKLVKSCFQAPPGWLFCGLDFASLEDRISALTTKDPNKLKVYTDGYDGHSLRAYAYFKERMPDIDPNSVESINSIQDKYKPERQDSKAPTFALTYQGTFKTLMKNCGFSAELAQSIEASYQTLYQVSIKWVQDKLNQASRVGYITVAFGLRVRTPLLHQVIRGTRKTPYEAEAEGRTAGNALGQSWCLLNSRASAEFLGGVRKSTFRLDIRPCAHIHDAQYMLVREDMAAILYTNKYLVEAVQWQDHPDIAHDEVKLGGELSIFWPDWAHEITIPNGATAADILALTADPS